MFESLKKFFKLVGGAVTVVTQDFVTGTQDASTPQIDTLKKVGR